MVNLLSTAFGAQWERGMLVPFKTDMSHGFNFSALAHEKQGFLVRGLVNRARSCFGYLIIGNVETHRVSEWLTWPAVADVAINKILANGTVVAGSWTTFVNIHFTEIPHETWWTAKKTHHALKVWGCLTALSVPSCGSDTLYLQTVFFFHFFIKKY